jgi:D-3-phosphoglycerate dehydrogenase / 2-oxoglutarate reductase
MKILTSPSSMGKVGPQPFDILSSEGFEIVNNPYGRKLTEEEVIELASDCIGIVAGVEPLSKRVMDALPKLRCISRVGIGMDSVDLEYAKKKGITVVNTPDGPTRSVAEMTLAMTMALLRRIPQADANIKNGVWKKEIGNLLFEKTIGVIGLGRIGRMVAEIFRKLGNPVIGYDLYPDKLWAENTNVKLVEISELLEQSDIVTVHIPPKKDQVPVLGSTELGKMKKSAFLINAARGGVIDEAVLIELLKENIIAGAAIDVFVEEPYNGPFSTLNNVILTPHLGSYASEGKLKMEIDAVQNLINELK